MGERPDYYEVLEVSPRASLPTIEAAYRSLMLRHHPDRVPAGRRVAAGERARLLNEARDTLSSPSRRAAYDLDRRRAEEGTYVPPAPRPAAAPRPARDMPPPPRQEATRPSATTVSRGEPGQWGRMLGGAALVLLVGYFVVLALAILGWFLTELLPHLLPLLAGF